MNLSQSMCKSAQNSTNIEGYSLKKGRLKKYIFRNHYTQTYFAKRLNLSAEEFKRKLTNRELFNKEQLRALINLMGAREAFKVIYFPSAKKRRKIYRQIFG